MSITKPITLNNKQQECVDNIEGCIMVLAGPGTGKTFTVIKRIKAMVQQKIEPEKILCLTFSEAATNEMKERLIKELGIVATNIGVYTYHAFCNELIQSYPIVFEVMDGVRLINDTAKITLMKQSIEEFNPVYYRDKWGNALFYTRELLLVVDEIKKNQLKEETYFDIIKNHPEWEKRLEELKRTLREKQENNKKIPQTLLNNIDTLNKKINKAKEAWKIYEIYSQKMKTNNFIDFNDMINFVLEAFETNETFLKEIAEKYSYLLVDEYQDTNKSQNNLIFSLLDAMKNKNIFVVGDDDQIIYGFQGAQTDNIEKFLNKYPNTKVICLEENNRTCQSILDFSYNIISQDKTRLENNQSFKHYNISKKLIAKNKEINALDKKPKLNVFADILQEYTFIVDEIEQIIKNDTTLIDETGEKKLSEIAILTKEHSEHDLFTELLEAKNIPYQRALGKSIFNIKSSTLLYFYIKALENPILYGDKLFVLLSSPPFNINLKDYMFLINQNSINHKDFIYNLKSNLNYSWENPESIQKFLTTYDELLEYKNTENLKNIVVEIINKTGIMEFFLTSTINKTENILGLKKIVDEAQAIMQLNPLANLKDFIDYLDNAFAENISIFIDKKDFIQNAIQLVTLHGSKGREFAHVYIPNLRKNRWENKHQTNSSPVPQAQILSDDEKKSIKIATLLKLLFVGITRAKHTLKLSYATKDKSTPQELTEFIANLDKNTFDVDIFDLDEAQYISLLANTIQRQPCAYQKEFENELLERIKNLVLSPTSLNSYLNCPRNFLYANLLNIQVQDANYDNANYGISIHKTLEYLIKEAKEKNTYPDLNSTLDFFEKVIKKQRFSSYQEHKRFLEQGKNSLTKYYPHFVQTSPDKILATEYNLENITIDKIKITGKIDRIELNNDGTISLYDYKTGSAKPKTQIEDGKNYEHYLNQLRFYKLAYEKQNPNQKVTQVGLIFVEEHEKNVYKNLNDNDNLIIEDKIKTTINEINKLKFAPVKQNENTCRFCQYKAFCNIDIF